MSTFSPTLNFGHCLTIKLTRENYLLWQAQILPYLRSHQLLGFVDGTTVAPDKMVITGDKEEATQVANPAYAQWLQQDQFVLSALLSSLSSEVLGQCLFLSTAREVWLHLDNLYSAQSRTRIMQIRMLLATLKKQDMQATEYFNKVKNYADTLAAAGEPLREDEIITYLLAGLIEEYDSFVTSITTRADSMSLSEVYNHFVSFEMRIMSRNGSLHGINSSVNYASKGGRNNNNNSGGGRGGNRGRGNRGRRSPQAANGAHRGGSADNANRLECQICGKSGHLAPQCWHRYDDNYQKEDKRSASFAANPSYSIDSNWYSDTGATDHITNDLERLTVREKYGGKDQIQTAGGSGHGHEDASLSR